MKFIIRLLVAGIVIFFGSVPTVAVSGVYEVHDCVTGPGQDIGEPAVFASNLGPNQWTYGTQHCDHKTGPTDWLGYAIWADQQPPYSYGDIARYRYTAPFGLGYSGFKAYTDPGGNQWKVSYIFHNDGSSGVSFSPTSLGVQVADYDLPAGQHRSDLVFRIRCEDVTCVPGGFARVVFANVTLTMTDPTPPLAFVHSGTLYNGGTVSGTRTASNLAIDAQSGVFRTYLMVNEQLVRWKDGTSVGPGVSCNPFAPTFNAYKPCETGLQSDWTVNTGSAPFKNGANSVQACAIDYSLNVACQSPYTVYVQN